MRCERKKAHQKEEQKTNKILIHFFGSFVCSISDLYVAVVCELWHWSVCRLPLTLTNYCMAYQHRQNEAISKKSTIFGVVLFYCIGWIVWGHSETTTTTATVSCENLSIGQFRSHRARFSCSAFFRHFACVFLWPFFVKIKSDQWSMSIIRNFSTDPHTMKH